MTVLLILTPVVEILLTIFLFKITPSWADYVVCGLSIFTWFVHTVYVWHLRYIHNVSVRGPSLVICVYLLTLVSLAVHLRSVIYQHVEHSANLNSAEEYVSYTKLGIQLIYLLTLFPKRDRIYRTELFAGSINYDATDTEQVTWDHIRSYGSVNISEPSVELIEAEYDANCFSKLSFYWLRGMFRKGAMGKLRSGTDLYRLPKRLNSSKIDKKFKHVLNGYSSDGEVDLDNNVSRGSTTGYSSLLHDSSIQIMDPGRYRRVEKPKTLFKALNSAFGCEYYTLGILKLVADGLGFAGPILLNFLVSYIENKNEPEYHGYIYACGLLLSTFLGTIFSTQFDYHVKNVGFKMRCAIITTVYQKTLSVNTVNMSKFSTGQIVNFMSTDTDRIINFCPSFHAFWSLPFQVAVSLYLLHQQVGLAFLAGLAFAIILIPINRQLAIKIGDLSSKMMEQKDSRVKLMTEILSGIRVIKFYSWEKHFTSQVNSIRDQELKNLKCQKYLDALCVYFWATTPVLISILTFTTYSLLGHQLTAAKVFTSLSLFIMLIGPLNAFPWVINGLMESWVSLKRVEEFFKLKTFDPISYFSQHLDITSSIRVDKGSFSWLPKDSNIISSSQNGRTNQMPGSTNENPAGSEDSTNENSSSLLMLSNINLHIRKGQFLGIIGKVGSGKSSLLNALLAEMEKVGGRISIEKRDHGFSYASQEPWIQHATVRDNILFGQRYQVGKYDAVIHACALTDDLKMLPAGDRTEVGENGMTLSGGQKARVALARAVYQDKEVYLLDDPLSAVDSHVANHLYYKCIMGMLKDKTRILCTHHVKYLKEADIVIQMEDGHIVKSGRPSEVLPTIKDIIKEDRETEVGRNEEEGEERGLMSEEEKEKGVVKLHVYKSYWTAVGNCLAPCILIALFLMQASRNINDWWLSYWVTHSHTSTNNNHNTSNLYSFVPELLHFNHNNTSSIPDLNITQATDNVKFYLMIYGCLAGANSIFTLFRAFLFAYGGIEAAQLLHKKLLSSILKAPVLFFDTTPLGRIVNRFSSDIYSIDDSLPFILNIFLAQAYGIFGTIIITCYGLPWFAIILVPLGLLYYKIQKYYRQTSRELKRISSVTLSPIYAHFTETITGLTTIRAMKASERFRRENLQKLDLNQRAQFANNTAARWLDFRLQMLGVAMVTGVSFIAVLEHHYRSVNPGLVGLAISYSLSITGLLGGVVMSFTETEKQLVSVERAEQYINNVPHESWTGLLFPPSYWPIQGSVLFSHVTMRYREDLPNALDGVTFETEPAENIGIVGRTGSGKSSLFLALFRMTEIQHGEIMIDGINLHHLDLRDVRSRLAVIPQDPFLFSGSVRENLDPTRCFTDNAIQTAIIRCHLDTVITRLGGLNAEVSEHGRRLSVGQRQLLCLARALLTKAKVLCIDEATASVDQETDSLIQATIQEEFRDSTVLTIAHRLNTIMDSDRVLVMSEGKVVEFSSPQTLLQNKDTLFYQMVHGKS
ncbi:hypothetical protein LOTGIDRAFT_183817 [Lottia gigantea]|uniref:ABC-type xenobiotic transporter n=1 Tax=Lottia gigantea TaxID=225164 RepID=V3ZSB2_LOTGI|nr:hypothetical protein LOTGIDRAFT_183817 [Lottia gigantea]ESO85415.1 hypothetical protein LOTGIDRAFT_183817 [Lottia gigantea]